MPLKEFGTEYSCKDCTSYQGGSLKSSFRSGLPTSLQVLKHSKFEIPFTQDVIPSGYLQSLCKCYAPSQYTLPAIQLRSPPRRATDRTGATNQDMHRYPCQSGGEVSKLMPMRGMELYPDSGHSGHTEDALPPDLDEIFT